MKRLILFALTLVLAIGLGLLIKADPGYMLLSYRSWTMEMPLWFGVVAVFLLFFIIHGLMRFFNYSTMVPTRISLWSNKRKMRQAYRQKNQGLISLTEGNWQIAEKQLVRSTKYCQSKLINYLAAARAAQERGENTKRDEYIQLAYKVQPSAKLAIGLTQAQLQISQKQLEQALATLKHLRETTPRHQYILKLLMQLYKELNDWERLAELLPDLRKYNVITSRQADELEQQTYQHILQLSLNKEKQDVGVLWNRLSKSLRKNPVLIEIYASYLINNHKHQEAESLLRYAIKNNWNDNLVYLYGKLTEGNVKKQFATAEAWLKHHKNNPTLLLTLARLAIANQLWGRARSYFENSIEYQPSIDAYLELGNLLEQQNEMTLAREMFRKGLELQTGTISMAATNSDVY